MFVCRVEGKTSLRGHAHENGDSGQTDFEMYVALTFILYFLQTLGGVCCQVYLIFVVC